MNKEIEKPYSVIPNKIIGYNILFDEVTDLGWYLYKSDAEKICIQLNSAFRYGYLKSELAK